MSDVAVGDAPRPAAAAGAPPRCAPWTPAELAILRERYPDGGSAACHAALPARSVGAIYELARRLGLRRQAPHMRKPPSTPPLDDAIRRLYASAPTPGAVKTFCQRHGRERQWVYRRALQLGCVPERHQRRPWSDAETAILDERQGQGTRAMQRALRRAGYARTEGAIQCQLRKRGETSGIDDPDLFNPPQIAAALGYSDRVVVGWIDRGWLKARQDKARGTHLVTRRALREFLIARPGDWDHRRCQQTYWLVDILAGRVGAHQ